MPTEEFIYYRGAFLPSSSCDIREYNTHGVLYEVVRIMEEVPLFLEDHILRLKQSIALTSDAICTPPDLSFFEETIRELIKRNKRSTGNIKIVLLPHKAEEILLCFIPHSYPHERQYANGVSTNFLFAERTAPQAKVHQQQLREKADRMIAQQALYEVLLVDSHHYVTEGSRANLFIVSGTTLYTAPPSMVLGGITRQKVMEILHGMKQPVKEEAWTYHRIIEEAEALFLTGTSPKILPIASCGTTHFKVRHKLVHHIMKQYDQIITHYIRIRKD
ncbi:MAG: hypothetical protein CSA95_07665 [Bacteroidetes bacterium]|nr:MAG: hypothetical protein CSA95_07665 [Bacteroidota bacterium]